MNTAESHSLDFFLFSWCKDYIKNNGRNSECQVAKACLVFFFFYPACTWRNSLKCHTPSHSLTLPRPGASGGFQQRHTGGRKLPIFCPTTGLHMLTSGDDREPKLTGEKLEPANHTHTHTHTPRTHSRGRVTGHSCPVNHPAG